MQQKAMIDQEEMDEFQRRVVGFLHRNDKIGDCIDELDEQLVNLVSVLHMEINGEVKANSVIESFERLVGAISDQMDSVYHILDLVSDWVEVPEGGLNTDIFNKAYQERMNE